MRVHASLVDPEVGGCQGGPDPLAAIYYYIKLLIHVAPFHKYLDPPLHQGGYT
jgi:hypothetical protein